MIKKISLILAIFGTTLAILPSCTRCKTCTYKNTGSNSPSPSTTYCDDDLTQAESDPNYTCN
ncbi:MAG: hypothetical protein K1X82_02485 [Bacteroidia bacterium]|nr:hypothetical protein [Bacteroidia bacterium]